MSEHPRMGRGEVRLRVQRPEGGGGSVCEEVRVQEHTDDGLYRVLSSPILVEGLAADDIIEVGGNGDFRVRRRGGNLAIQYFRGSQPGRSAEDGLVAEVDRLGGRLDVDGPQVLVFTIPLRSAGFARIEAVFDACANQVDGASWMFGNVYDPEDGSALDWWVV